MMNGVPFLGALMSGMTLPMLAVFLDQFRKQWAKREDDKKQVVPAS